MSLYYMRGRWYDPQAGRFIQEDPAGVDGGINVYAFAGDDPVNGSDPSGVFATDANGDVCSINAESCGDPLKVGPGGGIGEAIGPAGGFGGSIAGLSSSGPGRPLTGAEIKQFGNLCNAVDCSTIRISETPFDRSFTFHRTIFLSHDDVADVSILAHEMTHVARYEQSGEFRYIVDGLRAQISVG